MRVAVAELMSMARPLEDRDVDRLERLAHQDGAATSAKDRRDITRLLSRADRRLSPPLRARLEQLLRA